MEKDYDKQDLLNSIKKRFDQAQKAWEKQHKLSSEDMRFCSPDCQWDESVKQSRIGRPVYASDRINAQVKALVNAQRENRPAVNIHPVGDGADEEIAEVYQGIVRHIEVDSDADLAYDQSFEDIVRCGIGFFRVLTEYEPNSFDQHIKIDSIINPFSVYVDPTFEKLDGSDIKWAFIVNILTKDEYKEMYPDSSLASFTNSWIGLGNRNQGWFSNSGDTCTIAEYFVIDEEKKTIVKLIDGTIKDKKDLLPGENGLIELERETSEPVVKWYKLNGIEILEETTWPGSRIPLVPVFGDALLVDGERIYSGLVRNVKEEQMMLNVAKTTAIELIAAAPKAPWVGPEGFTAGHEADWQDVNVKNLAYLEYAVVDVNGDPLPPPTRNVQGPDLTPILEVMNSIEMDIKSTNNMYDPSLGQRVSNQSGVAVKALQQAGSTGNYHFSDNLSRAIRLLGRILIDLIPKIYSEKRVIRIIKEDDKHEMITVNGSGDPDEIGETDKDGVKKIYDITAGRFDVTVSSGPSYQTKRQENLSLLFDLAGKDPQLMGIAGDIIVSQIDSPIAERLKERLEKTLPPGLLEDSDQEIPVAIQQRLQQDRLLIQQLTLALQKETELADKVQQAENTKLQIAQMQKETELLKHQAQLQHDTNVLTFKEELEQLKAKNKQSHDLVMNIQKHLLANDQISHEGQVKIDIAHATKDITPPELLNPE